MNQVTKNFFVVLGIGSIGFVLGMLSAIYFADINMETPGDQTTTIPTTLTPSSEETSLTEDTVPAQGTPAENMPVVEEERGFSIAISTLPESQQMALRTMGIDGEELYITPKMIGCAEAKVGSARVAEIKGGAGVSISEGLTLIGCYSQE